MICTRCGRPVEDNRRFCMSCGAMVTQDGARQDQAAAGQHTDYGGVNAPRQINVPQKRKSRTALIVIVAAVLVVLAAAVITVVLMSGLFKTKTEGEPAGVGTELTQPAEVAGLTQTLSGSGFTMNYNPGLWKQEKIEDYDGLTYLANGGRLIIGPTNIVPAAFMGGLDLSYDIVAKNMYSVFAKMAQGYIPEGYSMKGGSDTFLELKEGIYYASIDYANDAGVSGKIYVIVSQKDKASLLLLTQSSGDAAGMEKNVIETLKSITFSS